MDELSIFCYEIMWGLNEFMFVGILVGVDLLFGVVIFIMFSLWLCGSDDEVCFEMICGYV